MKNYIPKLANYYQRLKLDVGGGQWRKCRFSGEKFYVRPEDVEFYKNMGVPLPTLCPNERLRRKLAYCTDRIYYNQSAATGDRIVSMYPPGWKFDVYEPKYWFSDNWDPMDYGIDVHAAGGGEGGGHGGAPVHFWKNFKRLQLEVPRLALYSDDTNKNS